MPEHDRIGYALIGLGSISQTAVLPAFTHSKKAKLVAVVTGDKDKGEKLGRRFGASVFGYDELSQCLRTPEVEAVYIATPQGEHEKYATAAANAGKHVLCEKPLAATVEQARNMVESCRKNEVQLMTAYRKCLEPSSVMLKGLITAGELGRIEVVHTLFTELHRLGDNAPPWLFSRTLAGGGPLTDLGVYCVNTCRWLVNEEPIAVNAVSWARDQRLYKEVEEGIAFRLDFASGLIVQATTSYGAAFSSFIRAHGENGWAELTPAFEFEKERNLTWNVGGHEFAKSFKPLDEFALELDYFSECICENKKPEPDGEQGLRDMVIINAIYESAQKKSTVPIEYERWQAA